MVKEKRDGSVKEITCAAGRSQLGKYGKKQLALPTVSSNSLMLTLLMIAATEGTMTHSS